MIASSFSLQYIGDVLQRRSSSAMLRQEGQIGMDVTTESKQLIYYVVER